MKRDEEFDLRLTRWLEEGPLEAPDRAVAAAIAHVRSHPRRRLSWPALWRRAMDSMHLTPVTPDQVGHPGRSLATAVAAVIILAVAIVAGVVVLGRAGGGEPVPGAAVVPAVAPSPSPTPTPPAAPTAISTTLACWSAPSPNETEVPVGQGTQIRGIVLECAYPATADARLQGTSTVDVSVDVAADQSANVWGSMELVGARGSWRGPWTGIVDPGYTTHRIAGALTGSGAYAGLQWRFTQTSADAGTTWDVAGTIEPVPAGQPAAGATGTIRVTGTETCEDMTIGSTGTSITDGDVQRVRGAGGACMEFASDPRVSGASMRTFNEDARWSDGSATWWGTMEIPGDTGTWTGVWSGTLDTAGNVAITGTCIGSGAYAGLEYRLGVGMASDASEFSLTGTIEPVG